MRQKDVIEVLKSIQFTWKGVQKGVKEDFIRRSQAFISIIYYVLDDFLAWLSRIELVVVPPT